MPSMIFFCGHAGTGKTTLAKRFMRDALRQPPRQPQASYCLLDKDTLYGGYSAAVMNVLTGNPDDRDSPVYLRHLRDPEYAGLIATARENLALGCTPIVVGPLSREVKARRLHDPAWLGLDGELAATRIRIVWVYLAEDEARRRIVARGNPNDAWKLAHWDEYRQRLFMPAPETHPELVFYDNTAADDSAYQALLAELLAD